MDFCRRRKDSEGFATGGWKGVTHTAYRQADAMGTRLVENVLGDLVALAKAKC